MEFKDHAIYYNGSSRIILSRAIYLVPFFNERDAALIRSKISTSIILRTAFETPRRCGRFSTDFHSLFSCLKSTDVTSRPCCMSVRHELKCWGTTSGTYICYQKMIRTVDHSSTGLVVTCLFRGTCTVSVHFSQQNWWWCGATVTVLWQYCRCVFQRSKSDTAINSRHVGIAECRRYTRIHASSCEDCPQEYC